MGLQLKNQGAFTVFGMIISGGDAAKIPPVKVQLPQLFQGHSHAQEESNGRHCSRRAADVDLTGLL